MADISVERKPRSPVPVIVGILLLLVLAFVIWRYVSTHRAGGPGAAAPPAAADSTHR